MNEFITSILDRLQMEFAPAALGEALAVFVSNLIVALVTFGKTHLG